MKQRTSELWSESELQQLMALAADGYEYKEIARQFPRRTVRALRAKVERIGMTPEQKARAQAHHRKRYAAQRIQRLSVAPNENVVVPITIPRFVVDDLYRRLSILPTLENMLCGTPLRTCSALDRPAGLYYAG